MARFDLSDVEWGLIQPLLPNKPRGVARVNDRRSEINFPGATYESSLLYLVIRLT